MGLTSGPRVAVARSVGALAWWRARVVHPQRRQSGIRAGYARL